MYIYITYIYIYVLYTNIYIYICICMNHIASTSWGTPKSFETVRLGQAGPGYATLARDGPKESMGSVGHPDGCSFGAVGGGVPWLVFSDKWSINGYFNGEQI